MTGRLTLCATPIGNLGDASPRLAEVLASADLIFAEDTRRTSILLRHLGVSRPLRSYFVGNEARRSDELVELMREGKHVALVSDAGMPGISDPGGRAVRSVIDAGFPVGVVAGPSAVTAAVAVAGFDSDRFCFEGFLPRRGGEREARLERIAADDRPVVFFAAPSRLVADLRDLAAVVDSDRAVVVTRELTKLHEEVWRGSVPEAVAEFEGREVRGEITVVVDGGVRTHVSMEAALTDVQRLTDDGVSVSDAVRTVSDLSGIRRRELYEAALRARDGA